MRRLLFSAMAASAVVLSFTSSAGAYEATGVVYKVNARANTVQLVNGDSYTLPADTNLSDLTPGQTVQISWDLQNPIEIGHGGDHLGVSHLVASKLDLVN